MNKFSSLIKSNNFSMVFQKIIYFSTFLKMLTTTVRPDNAAAAACSLTPRAGHHSYTHKHTRTDTLEISLCFSYIVNF